MEPLSLFACKWEFPRVSHIHNAAERIAAFIERVSAERPADSLPPEFIALELRFKFRKASTRTPPPGPPGQETTLPQRHSGDMVAQRKFVASGEQWALHYVRCPLGLPGPTRLQKTLQLQKREASRGRSTENMHRSFRVAYIFRDAMMEDEVEEAWVRDSDTVVCKVDLAVERRLEAEGHFANESTAMKVIVALV